jgi:hypothetical protein
VMSRRRLLLVCTLVLICGAFAGWLYLHRDRVTLSNFGSIEVDVPLKEVEALLGRGPDHIWKTLGRVESPDVFVTNADPIVQEKMTHRMYHLYQWQSSELTIVVVVDEAGKVVCRYQSGPVVEPWYVRFLQTVKRSFGRR